MEEDKTLKPKYNRVLYVRKTLKKKKDATDEERFLELIHVHEAARRFNEVKPNTLNKYFRKGKIVMKAVQVRGGRYFYKNQVDHVVKLIRAYEADQEKKAQEKD